MGVKLVGGRKRIFLLNVPVDIVPENILEDVIRDLLLDKGKHQIVFLTLRGLLKARGNSEYADTVRKASLVIPISKRIIRGAKFLGRTEPVRYMPFDFAIKLLGILEKHHHSLYLAGSKPAELQITTNNLRDSFPGIGIVGRYAGYFKKEVEENMILAIKKASPSLIFFGNGIPGRSNWFSKNMKNLNPGIFLWCGNCFDIFSGRKRKISKKSWESGRFAVWEGLRKPWKVVMIFPHIYYLLLLLIHKIRKI
ncbi:MAG: WecB/TagA/CpsF family glycosyltransferase [Spirochaetales bacterium]|nr:WecB/TagA/CpsF family glycosyltransferase [Spirochaetales bacterium]